jgi:hypothetical protein
LGAFFFFGATGFPLVMLLTTPNWLRWCSRAMRVEKMSKFLWSCVFSWHDFSFENFLLSLNVCVFASLFGGLSLHHSLEFGCFPSFSFFFCRFIWWCFDNFKLVEIMF